MSEVENTEQLKAPSKPAALDPSRPRGWVDVAIEKIAKAEQSGVDLSPLGHDVLQTLSEFAARPEGQRVPGDQAHKLNHIKTALRLVEQTLYGRA